MRLLLVTLGWAALLACQPPIDINEAPGLVADVGGAAQTTVMQAEPVVLFVYVSDLDGDVPITVTVDSDLSGRVATEVVNVLPADLRLELLLPDTGTHTLTLVADDGRTDGERTRTVQATVDGAPSLPAVQITPAAPGTNEDLVGVWTESTDPEGEALLYTATWTLDSGVELQSQTTTAPTNTLPARFTEYGETLTLTVTACEANPGGTACRSPSNLSSATASVRVENQAPTAPTSVRLTPTVPHAAQAVFCTGEGSVDPEGSAITHTTRWRRWLGSSWDANSPWQGEWLPAEAMQAGDRWLCAVSGNDGRQDGDEASVVVEVREQYSVPNADVGISGTFFGQEALRRTVGLDLDDDGVSDALVGTVAKVGNEPASLAWFDQATVLAATGTLPLSDADTLWAAPDSMGAAADLLRIADINGDGGDDLLLSSPHNQTVDGAPDPTVWVMDPSLRTPAPSQDLRTASARIALDPGVLGQDVHLAVGAAPLIGGPALDVLVARGATATGAGITEREVQLYNGATLTYDGTTSPAPSVRLDPTGLPGRFADALAAPADLNGDGVLELVTAGATSVDFDGTASTVQIFATSVLTGVQTVAAAQTEIRETAAFGELGATVAVLPDIDGDGDDELLVGLPGAAANAGAVPAAGRVRLFLGRPDLPAVLTAADAHLSFEGTVEDGLLGTRIVVLGDLGRDGLPEVAITAPGAADGRGWVAIFRGSDLATAAQTSNPSLDLTDAAWIAEGATDGANLTVPGPAADLDGDGALDLLLASPGALQRAGTLHLLLSDR